VRGVVAESRGERRAIAAEAAFEVHRLPEAAEASPFLGAQRRCLTERGAEPADQRGER